MMCLFLVLLVVKLEKSDEFIVPFCAGISGFGFIHAS